MVVEEAQPNLSEAHECFQILRAYDYVISKAALLRRKRDLLKPEIIWNIEKGLKLSLEDRPPRSSHRTNGHSLSRHRFAWCPFQRRQLQDGGVLTLAQLRNQDNFSLGKLKRVVMHGWLV